MTIEYTLVVLSTVLPTETEPTTTVPTETEPTTTVPTETEPSTTGKGSCVFFLQKDIICCDIM